MLVWRFGHNHWGFQNRRTQVFNLYMCEFVCCLNGSSSPRGQKYWSDQTSVSLLKHSSTPRTDYLVLRRCINRMVKEILQLALSCQASELSYLARSSAGRAALGIKPREGWRLLGNLEWEWWRSSIVPSSLQSQETWLYQYCWMTWSKSVFNANFGVLVIVPFDKETLVALIHSKLLDLLRYWESACDSTIVN